ncbi:MAG TPA: hypothetical protein VMX35_07630 [Acidobacteriota bacterium]|nr:hypothetical protein [Acidobacteriota bacterium]
MLYAIDYSFVDGSVKIKLATFFFDGKEIWYEIRSDSPQATSRHFVHEDLRKQLNNIIRLPIMRSELRARTMPWYFKKLKPNTMDHFCNIRHDSTYYHFSSIRKISS